MIRVMTMLAAIAVLASSGRAADITTCDTIVPAGETAVLLNDLSGCDSGVALGEHAALQMNGHVIAGARFGVYCIGRRCSIAGPGEIASAGFGIFLSSSARLSIADVAIHDSAEEGIHCPDSGCVIRATDLTLARNGFGATSPGGPEYSYDVSAKIVRGTNVTVTDNAGFGIYAARFNLQDLTCTGNGNVGLYVGRGRLVDSVVTGNNGWDTGIDIFAARRPRLVGTTCGRSASGSGATPIGPPWGICTDD